MVLLFAYTVQEKFSLKIWLGYAISFAEKIEFPCYLKRKNDSSHTQVQNSWFLGWLIDLSILLGSRLARETLSIIFILAINM